MSTEKNNEAQDTLKFKIPANNAVPSDSTKVFKVSKKPGSPERNSTARSMKRMPEQQSQNNARRPQPEQQSQHNAKRPQPQSHSAGQRPVDPRQPLKRINPDNSTPPVKNVQAAPKKKKKKRRPFGSFMYTLILIVILSFTVYSAFALYYITKISPIENTGQYKNDESNMLYSSDVKNILVIGTDARDTSTRGLSDSMILMSINKNNKKIQMTSFMRDMYTQIEGYGSEKLNAAYSHGGCELLIDTIEDSFKVRIDGCVTVNFSAVAYIVDAVGGVEISISDSEAEAINTILYSEVNEIMGDNPDSDFLPGAGKYKLNGKQALSYSRIRYVGDADFERTQRQRTVVNQILANMKSVNPITLNKNIKKALPYIGTDLSVSDMYLLSLRLPMLLIGYDIEQYRIPAEDTWWYDETEDGQSILGVDFAANTQIIKEKIYLS